METFYDNYVKNEVKVDKNCLRRHETDHLPTPRTLRSLL